MQGGMRHMRDELAGGTGNPFDDYIQASDHARNGK
jgi:hypothetical protein